MEPEIVDCPTCKGTGSAIKAPGFGPACKTCGGVTTVVMEDGVVCKRMGISGTIYENPVTGQRKATFPHRSRKK